MAGSSIRRTEKFVQTSAICSAHTVNGDCLTCKDRRGEFLRNVVNQ